MSSTKQNSFFKIISIILIISFIVMDISWANPDIGKARTSTLALPSMFKGMLQSPAFHGIQLSPMEKSELLYSLQNISEYFFDVPANVAKERELYVAGVMRRKLKAQGVDIAPGIELDRIRIEERIVYVPYQNNNTLYVITIDDKNNVSISTGKRPTDTAHVDLSEVSISLSIGGTKAGAAAINENADIVAMVDDVKWKNVLDHPVKQGTPGEVEQIIMDQIERVLVKGNLEVRTLQKIGIAFAGPLNEEEGIVGVPFAAPNLPFEKYPLKRNLEKLLKEKYDRDINVQILNDSSAAVMGEMSPKGGLKDKEAGMAVIIGTGINGTAAKGGKPYYGKHQEIKELGHNIVPTDLLAEDRQVKGMAFTYTGKQTLGDHPKDESGNDIKGDFEDLYSGPNLDKRFKLSGYTLMNITEQAKKGDTKAFDLIHTIGIEIGQVLAAFIYAYQDEDFVRNIVLVSGVAENLGKDVDGDPFFTKIREGAYEELIKAGLEKQKALKLSKGITRSQLSYERELIAFVPEKKPAAKIIDEHQVKGRFENISESSNILVVADKDGTLTQTNEPITPEMINRIIGLLEKNVHFHILTGGVIANSEEFVIKPLEKEIARRGLQDKLPYLRVYLISGNMWLLWDKKGNRKQHLGEKMFSDEQVVNIHKACVKAFFEFAEKYDGKKISVKEEMQELEKAKEVKRINQIFDGFIEKHKDVFGYICLEESVNRKITFEMKKGKDKCALPDIACEQVVEKLCTRSMEILKDEYGFVAPNVTYGATFIDITVSGKKESFDEMVSEFDKPFVLALGDGRNDYEFLEGKINKGEKVSVFVGGQKKDIPEDVLLWNDKGPKASEVILNILAGVIDVNEHEQQVKFLEDAKRYRELARSEVNNPHKKQEFSQKAEKSLRKYYESKVRSIKEHSKGSVFSLQDKWLDVFRNPDDGKQIRSIDIMTAGGGGDVLGGMFFALELKKLLGSSINVRVFTTNLKRGKENPKGGPMQMSSVKTAEGKPIKALANSKNFYLVEEGLNTEVTLTDEQGRKIERDSGDTGIFYNALVPLSDGELVDLAKENGIDIVMLDVSKSGQELAEDYMQMNAGDMDNRFVFGLDMGGDILARFPSEINNEQEHPERDIRSPNTDAVVLDMLTELESCVSDRVLLGVSALGGDGELGKTLLEYLQDFYYDGQVQGVLDNLGFMEQKDPAKQAFVSTMLEAVRAVDSEVSGNFLMRIFASSQIPLDGADAVFGTFQDKVQGWFDIFHRQNRVAQASPGLFYDPNFACSPIPEVSGKTIRHGTRTEVLPFLYPSTLFLKPSDVSAKIVSENMRKRSLGWHEKDELLRSMGYQTEMTDPNNVRDRRDINQFLLKQIIIEKILKTNVSGKLSDAIRNKAQSLSLKAYPEIRSDLLTLADKMDALYEKTIGEIAQQWIDNDKQRSAVEARLKQWFDNKDMQKRGPRNFPPYLYFSFKTYFSKQISAYVLHLDGKKDIDRLFRTLDFFYDLLNKNNNISYLLIRPDAVDQLDTVISILEQNDCKVVYKGEKRRISAEKAQKIYEEHRQKDFYDWLIGYMTDGEVIPVLVKLPHGKDVNWFSKKVVGHKNGLKEDGTVATKTIRGQLMENADRERTSFTNKVHVADNFESAVREINIVMGERFLNAIMSIDDAGRDKEEKKQSENEKVIELGLDIKAALDILRADYINGTNETSPGTFRKQTHVIGKKLAEKAKEIVGTDDAVVVFPWRAALGLALPFGETFKRFAHIGLARDEQTLQPSEYYINFDAILEDPGNTKIVLADPMLATGGSMLYTLEKMLTMGVKEENITVSCVLSAPEGLSVILSRYPKINIICGAIDEKLDQRGFIVPGLGDFGDRYFDDISDEELMFMAKNAILDPYDLEALLKRMGRKPRIEKSDQKGNDKGKGKTFYSVDPFSAGFAGLLAVTGIKEIINFIGPELAMFFAFIVGGIGLLIYVGISSGKRVKRDLKAVEIYYAFLKEYEKDPGIDLFVVAEKKIPEDMVQLVSAIDQGRAFGLTTYERKIYDLLYLGPLADKELFNKKVKEQSSNDSALFAINPFALGLIAVAGWQAAKKDLWFMIIVGSIISALFAKRIYKDYKKQQYKRFGLKGSEKENEEIYQWLKLLKSKIDIDKIEWEHVNIPRLVANIQKAIEGHGAFSIAVAPVYKKLSKEEIRKKIRQGSSGYKQWVSDNSYGHSNVSLANLKIIELTETDRSYRVFFSADMEYSSYGIATSLSNSKEGSGKDVMKRFSNTVEIPKEQEIFVTPEKKEDQLDSVAKKRKNLYSMDPFAVGILGSVFFQVLKDSFIELSVLLSAGVLLFLGVEIYKRLRKGKRKSIPSNIETLGEKKAQKKIFLETALVFGLVSLFVFVGKPFGIFTSIGFATTGVITLLLYDIGKKLLLLRFEKNKDTKMINDQKKKNIFAKLLWPSSFVLGMISVYMGYNAFVFAPFLMSFGFAVLSVINQLTYNKKLHSGKLTKKYLFYKFFVSTSLACAAGVHTVLLIMHFSCLPYSVLTKMMLIGVSSIGISGAMANLFIVYFDLKDREEYPMSYIISEEVSTDDAVRIIEQKSRPIASEEITLLIKHAGLYAFPSQEAIVVGNVELYRTQYKKMVRLLSALTKGKYVDFLIMVARGSDDKDIWNSVHNILIKENIKYPVLEIAQAEYQRRKNNRKWYNEGMSNQNLNSIEPFSILVLASVVGNFVLEHLLFFSVIITVVLGWGMYKIYIKVSKHKKGFFEKEVRMKNELSKDFIKELDEEVSVAFVVPMYNDFQELLKRSEYNPAGKNAIRKKIMQLQQLRELNHNFKWKLVFIDDGSQENMSAVTARVIWDDFQAEAQRSGMELEKGCVEIMRISENEKHEKQSFKGYAVRKAMKHLIETGQHDYIGFTDIDTSVDLRQTGNLLKSLSKKDVSAAIGSRWIKDAKIIDLTVMEKMASFVYNFLVGKIHPSLKSIKDTQRGFKLFDVNMLFKILPLAVDNGLSFDTELLLLVQDVAGGKIEEVAVTFKGDRGKRSFNYQKQIVRMVKGLIAQKRHISQLKKNIVVELNEEKPQEEKVRHHCTKKDMDNVVEAVQGKKEMLVHGLFGLIKKNIDKKYEDLLEALDVLENEFVQDSVEYKSAEKFIKKLVMKYQLNAVEKELLWLAMESKHIELPQIREVKQEKVTELFEIVEGYINNRRALVIDALNRSRDILNDMNNDHQMPEYSVSVDVDDNTEQIVLAVDNMLTIIGVAEKASKQTDLLLEQKKTLLKYKNTLYTDAIIVSIIVKAMTAKKQNQSLIIGLDTGWIPGIQEKQLQGQALSGLLQQLKGLEKTLRNLGLDNVKVILEDKEDLETEILLAMSDASTDFNNVIVLAGKDVINSEKLALIRYGNGHEKAFMAWIDASLLRESYRTNKEKIDQQLYIAIVEMITLTLEASVGKDISTSVLVSDVDIHNNLIMFLPPADIYSYNTIRQRYLGYIKTLQSA